jgi:hypothetical protein
VSYDTSRFFYFNARHVKMGNAVAQLVNALRVKPEVAGSIPVEFFIDIILPAAL